MNEYPSVEQGRVGIRLDKPEYTVAPAGNTTIMVTLRNQGLDDDRFALSVGGVPGAWVSSSQPVVSLTPGEEKETDLVIQTPASDEVKIGEISLTIRATSQQHPDQFSEIKVKLSIKIETVPSLVAIEMESDQIALAPGGGTTFMLKLTNNGTSFDKLRLFIDDISSGWISTPSPITELNPGEEKEISVTITPPRTSESRAGHHPITIRLVSQVFPNQVATHNAALTIGAFSQFQSELQPPSPIEAEQNAQVIVTNEGNAEEAFKIHWESQENKLDFELWQQEGEEVVFKEIQDHELGVEPGKQGIAYFRAGLRQRPLIGFTKAYPFQVRVRSRSSGDDVQIHDSEVNDRGIIPIWVLPLVFVLCVIITCFGIFIYNWRQAAAPPIAGDDSWVRVQESGVLRVATSADYPPFSFYNKVYVIDGFDAALIRDIGTQLGVQVKIEDYAFEGLGATLNVGQADVAIAAISVTPERELLFDFSNIYYVGQDGILARANSDISEITDPSQMAGLRIGIQKFSVYENWAQDVLVAGGIITQDLLFAYSKPEHAIIDLRHERLDLVIMDLQPATLALLDGDLNLVGQGLNQQRLAIAFPKGANTLRWKINEALLTLQNAGRVNQLAEIYLGLSPEDIIPPPTPEPTPEITQTPLPTVTQDPTPPPCVDSMTFIEDLNYDDEDLTNFPLIDPGVAFQKGWRIRNSGTCSWNSSYFVKYTHGNDPAAQMGGQPTSIQGEVNPGQTYDLYVDLVSPDVAGKYVGYWQIHNAANQAFGQTIWVAVEVRNTDPEAPTATVTPEFTPTPTEVPPEPTATEISPEPTATEVPPEPTPTEEPGADLRDTTWVMEGYLANIEDEQLTDAIPDVNVELIFQEDGNLEGNSGCNTFSGRYVTDGKALAFREILGTNITCNDPEGIMDQESTFLALLDQAEEYRINENGQLEIIRFVIENEARVEKIILRFGDLNAGL